MVTAAASGELLNGLVFQVSSRLPHMVDRAYQISWDNLRGFMDTLQAFDGLSATLKDRFTSVVWQGAYRYCVDGLNVSRISSDRY